MRETIELAARAALIGGGATIVMDAWALLLRRVGAPSLDLALLGRWIAHLPRGRVRHESIARAAAVPGERLLGWGAHYSIGVTFAGLLLATYGLEWARSPSVGPALVIGLVTVLAPWLVLQPAMGAGVASSKTEAPVFHALKSLATHTVYGLGLYLAALVTAPLFPAGA